VRLALCFALLVGCSFQHGVAPNGTRDADVDTPVVDAPDAPPPADAPVDAHGCPSDFVAITGGQPTSRYKFYPYDGGGGTNGTSGVSFAQASATCAGQGAYVAIADDANELTAFDGIQQNPGALGYWVGITDAAAEGTWRTVLGAPATYLPWATGQPNGATTANCAVGYQRQYYDIDCAVAAHVFICECTQ
jgi:hypothetical protein